MRFERIAFTGLCAALAIAIAGVLGGEIKRKEEGKDHKPGRSPG